MNKPREQEALNAYFKLLQNKGASSENLQRRGQFLEVLIPSLADVPVDGLAYREVVESILPTIDTPNWPFFLSVIREYFHFWIMDIKAIAALHGDAGYEIEPSEWLPVENDLKTLWKQIEIEKFTSVELWPVKSYTHALRQAGADQGLIDTRVKLVKLAIVRMRTAPELNNKHYRLTVDATMHLFKVKDTRDLFLAVVREFYHFWIGDPEAENYILIDKLTDVI